MQRYEDGIMTQCSQIPQHHICIGLWNENCGIGEKERMILISHFMEFQVGFKVLLSVLSRL